MLPLPLRLGVFTVLCLLAGAPAAGPLAEAYREDADRILRAARSSTRGYEDLRELCDTIGPRLSGSPQLEAAVDWAEALMRERGLSNVTLEPVQVPVWVRGGESARLMEPYDLRLDMLGLGRSVGTPPEGITAPVVVVSDSLELFSLPPESVEGGIVVYDVPFTTYGETVRYRSRGASIAAARGAVAALVRSVGPVSLDTPHTGALRYDPRLPRVPGAAITVEAATHLHRLQDAGVTPVVRLSMEAETLPDRTSHNVMGELVGTERPDEVVVVGGHLDAWDVGQGAQDDGVGCLIALEAVTLLKDLGLTPRRTLRVVWWTNEENGLAGGKTYAANRPDAAETHIAALESDSGNGPASGFRLDVRALYPEGADHGDSVAARYAANGRFAGAHAVAADIASLLGPVDGGVIRKGGGGADISPLNRMGVPGLGLDHDTRDYFAIHHTRADTFEKIDLGDMQRNTAIMAVMLYVLADMPGRLTEAPGR